MAFRDVRRVRRNSVRDHADLHVVAVRQTEMLFGCDVAQHGRTIPADLCRTDGARDVVVARRDVRREWPERVEWRLLTPLELLVHVLLDQMHRDVARSLVHGLNLQLPPNPLDLPLRSQLSTLPLL